MKIGFIGLGRMGLNMTKRLISKGHNVVAFDINDRAKKDAKEFGAELAHDLEDFNTMLGEQKIIWVMVPAGKITDVTIEKLGELLSKGDIVINGGNTLYKDSINHAEFLGVKGIEFLDAGTSGGLWGLANGYCMMVGGKKEVFDVVEPIIKALAPDDGYAYVGPTGSGHYVKMIHNGIEYAMLQAYAEGFEILNSKKEFDLDLHKISKLWNHGSVVRSWLLELAESAFEKDPQLDDIRGYVEDSGEGRWTINEAIDQNVPAPTISLALYERFRSRQDDSFANKVIAALRNEFGGHRVIKK